MRTERKLFSCFQPTILGPGDPRQTVCKAVAVVCGEGILKRAYKYLKLPAGTRKGRVSPDRRWEEADLFQKAAGVSCKASFDQAIGNMRFLFEILHAPLTQINPFVTMGFICFKKLVNALVATIQLLQQVYSVDSCARLERVGIFDVRKTDRFAIAAVKCISVILLVHVDEIFKTLCQFIWTRLKSASEPRDFTWAGAVSNLLIFETVDITTSNVMLVGTPYLFFISIMYSKLNKESVINYAVFQEENLIAYHIVHRKLISSTVYSVQQS